MSRQKRIIQVLEPELVLAGSSDNMTEHHIKSTTHYFSDLYSIHSLHQEVFDIVVHGFTGEVSKTSYTELYISGSHKYPDFFKILAKCWKHTTQVNQCHLTWFPGLKMKQVNEILQDLRQERPVFVISQKMKKYLNTEYIQTLPEKFYGVYIPVTEPCISFIHPQTLRCGTTTKSNTIRWKIAYRCITSQQNNTIRKILDLVEASDPKNLNDSKESHEVSHEYSMFPYPQAARTYEEIMCGHSDVLWPYEVKPSPQLDSELVQAIKNSVEKHGIATIPLSSQFLQRYIEELEKYMYQMMNYHPKELEMKNLFQPGVLQKSEEKQKEYHYRNVKQKQSKHIPQGHGRTLYGHHSKAIKQLLMDISPVISHAVHAIYPESIHATINTSELIIQYEQ